MLSKDIKKWESIDLESPPVDSAAEERNGQDGFGGYVQDK
jgi:hypothetical protein